MTMHDLNDLPAGRDELRDMLERANPPPLTRRQHKASPRAQRVWDRLGDWYGARFADMFGDRPPQDWCALIDRVSNDELISVLTLVRERHVTFPPTLPEFASLVKETRAPRPALPSMPEKLTEYVTRNYRLTPAQQSAPWTFLYRSESGRHFVTAVVIAADGESPGYRVTVDDMQMAAHRP